MAQSILVTCILFVILLFTKPLEAFSVKREAPRHITWVENLSLVALENTQKPSEVDLSFSLHGEDEIIKLHLTPNHEILSKLESVHYLRSDGSVSSIKPVQRSHRSVFKGDAFLNDVGNNMWNRVGAARIAIRQYGDDPLFDGTFTIGNDLFHVQLESTFRRTQTSDHALPPKSSKSLMVVWRDGDDRQHVHGGNLRREDAGDELRCGLDSGSQSRLRRHTTAGHAPSLWERQNWGGGGDLRDTIGSTDGCPTTRLIALLGVATDCSYTADFESAAEVEAHIISEINSASQIYEDTFNISLAIRNLSISDADCSSVSTSLRWNVPCTDSADTRTRLSRFSEWRGQFQDGNALWTLLSGCRTGSTVGISWLGEVCRQGSTSFTSDGTSQTSSSTNIVIRNSQEWQVIAHEIGHSFGATHDCTTNTCDTQVGDSSACCPLTSSTCNANGQYIMNPSASSGIREFSPCTIGAICSAIGQGRLQTNCLLDNDDDVTIIDTPTCATASGCSFTEPTAAPTGGPTINTFGGRTGDSDSWLDENRNVVIIIASVGGSVVILIIAACIFCRVRRRRRARMAKEAQVSAMQYNVNRVVYR
ncbi:zinc metalloprotease mde10 [Thelonectria olida]|uniref:Zinc metalloprotease mde10 n=1 Tax=Thelonectria olida TaxID=1576542 RepID=A0A9P8WD56_9HYPO|nr:zinc metalloprotease mde10 [Thelonectria olida]